MGNSQGSGLAGGTAAESRCGPEVPGGWVPHSLRGKNIFGNTKTSSSQVLEQYEVDGDDFLHCIVQRDDSWLQQFIWKQNEYGMARNSSREQGPQSAGPRELSLAMLKDSNRRSFCHKQTPSTPLVTFGHSTSFAMHRMTNVRGRKRSCCNTTAQGTTLTVRLQGDSVQTNGRNVYTRMSGPSFHKPSSYARSALCDQCGGPGSVRRWLQTAGQILPLGVFTVSQGGRKHLPPFCARAVDRVHRSDCHQVLLNSYVM
jgi:hypothetical protein